METPPIYVINFQDESRKQNMIRRFDAFGISLHFVPPVFTGDSRLEGNGTEIGNKRVWSIMLQHLDSIRDFYFGDSKANHCIICEDDILISKYFARDMPYILKHFNQLNLDVLLLGYLLPYKWSKKDNLILDLDLGGEGRGRGPEYTFKYYADDLWGSQMYLISRNHAKYLLDTFTVDWAQSHLESPFSPDWILTKKGNRAMLYPMLAVEEGNTKTDHWGQNNFHQNCFLANYDPAIYF